MAAPVPTATEPAPTESVVSNPARLRRSPASTFWIFWGALALMLVFGWLIWRFVHNTGFKDVDARRADERAKIYSDVATASDKALHDPAGWLSKDKGTVRLPIDSAMQLTLSELKASQPHAAYPIAATNPAPAPAPAAGGAAATPAAGKPAAGTPATANDNNPVLPNQSAAPAAPPQPDKPNPSSGAVLGPTPGGNPPLGTVPAATPPPASEASPTPTPAPTPETALPASHLQPPPPGPR